MENVKHVQEAKLTLEQIEAGRQQYHQELQALAKAEQALQEQEQQRAVEESTLITDKTIAPLEKDEPLKKIRSTLTEIRNGRQEKLREFRTILRKLAELASQQQQYVKDDDKEKSPRAEFAGKDLLGKVVFMEGLAKTSETFTTNGNIIQSIWEFEKAQIQEEHKAFVDKRTKKIESNTKTDLSMMAERLLAKTPDSIRETRRQYQIELRTILSGLAEICKRLPVEGISQPLSREGVGKQQRSDGLGKALVDLRDLRAKAQHLYTDALEAFARDKTSGNKENQEISAKAKFRAMDLLDQIFFMEGLVKAISAPLSEHLAKLVEDYADLTDDVRKNLDDVSTARRQFLVGLKARRGKGETVTVSEHEIYNFTQQEESIAKTLSALVANERSTAEKYCTDAVNKLLPVVTHLNKPSFEAIRKDLADSIRDYEVLMLELGKETSEPNVVINMYLTAGECEVPKDYKIPFFSKIKKLPGKSPEERRVISYVTEQVGTCQTTLKTFRGKQRDILDKLYKEKEKLDVLKADLSRVAFTIPADDRFPSLQLTVQETHAAFKAKCKRLEALMAKFAAVQKGTQAEETETMNVAKIALSRSSTEGEKEVIKDAVWGTFEFASLAPRVKVKDRRLSAESKEQQAKRAQENAADEGGLSSGLTSPDSGDGDEGHEDLERKQGQRRPSVAMTSFERPKTEATPTPFEISGTQSGSQSSSQSTASSVATTTPAVVNKAPRTSVFSRILGKSSQPTASGKPAVGSSPDRRESKVNVKPVVPFDDRRMSQSVSGQPTPSTTQATMFSGSSGGVVLPTDKVSHLESAITLEKDDANLNGQASDFSSLLPPEVAGDNESAAGNSNADVENPFGL